MNTLKTPEQTSKKRQSVIKAHDTPTKQLVSAPKVEPIQIDKYIPNDVWKQIIKACKDKQKLLNILNEINNINLDPTKQTTQGPVQYLNKDGIITVSQSVKKESGNCLVQGVHYSHFGDRKRIVWSVNSVDKIIVATAFFDEHQGSIRIVNPYENATAMASKSKLPSGISISQDLVLSGGYISTKQLQQLILSQNQQNEKFM